MTEIHTYRCDVCGKTFDEEDDCYKHEMGHNVAKLKNVVVMMDSDGEILPLDDMHTAIERSYAIYVRCKDAANLLECSYKRKEGKQNGNQKRILRCRVVG